MLPEGVTLAEAGLSDSVRGVVLPVNPTGRLIVAHADGRSLAEIACVLAERFGLAREQALADVLTFARELNEKLLLNLHRRGDPFRLAGRWLRSAGCLFPLGIVPEPPRRRRALATTGHAVAALAVARALAGFGLAAATGTGASTLFVLASLGVRDLPTAVALGGAVGVGIVAHEGGHAARLRGVPACVAVGGLRPFVLHAPLDARRRASAALAGPAAGVALGWVVLAAALAFDAEIAAVASVILAAQALGLTVGARDGRRACGLS